MDRTQGKNWDQLCATAEPMKWAGNHAKMVKTIGTRTYTLDPSERYNRWL